MTKEEKIKKRIEKLLFMAVFIVGFLSGYSFLTPYLSTLTLSQPIVAGVPEFKEQTLGALTRKREIIGFLPYWMISKKTPVYPQKLTQLVFFNVEVNSKGELLLQDKNGSPTLEWSFFFSDYFQDLYKQAKANGTKVVLAINNFEMNSIDKLIRNKSVMQNFTANLKDLVSKYELDGVNIDFEYPTDEKLPDAFYFGRFLSYLKDELTKAEPNFTLSIDLMANALVKNPDYDISKIESVVDQIIVMTYDYHHPGSKTAGPIAPLYGGANERSVNEVISFLRGKVADEKIIMGIPFYGYEWETVSGTYRSPVVENTETALASYGRMQDFILSRNDIKVYWHEIAKSPWLTYWDGAARQIYFENNESLENKVQYALKNNLGGIAVWALGYEGEYLEPWNIIGKYYLGVVSK